MKVKVWVSHEGRVGENPKASQAGDVIFIYPMDSPHFQKTQETMVCVIMDLYVPCSEDESCESYKKGIRFELDYENRKVKWACNNCPDHSRCEIQTYNQPIFGVGHTEEEPKIIHKNRHKISLDFLSGDSKTLVEKVDKTEAEKIELVATAEKNPQLKTALIDKTNILAADK